MVHRLILGCVLTAFFVWVAIRYFGAETQEMLWLLLMSFVLISLLILLALLFAFVARKLLRSLRGDSFLDEVLHGAKNDAKNEVRNGDDSTNGESAIGEQTKTGQGKGGEPG